MLTIASECRLPTRWGPTRLLDLRSDGEAMLAQVFGRPDARPTLARIHSACLTSEVLGSDRCDCARQLRASQAWMAQDGRGILVYTHDEGRGIGLANKLAAYARQDHEGLDTVDANVALGLPVDARTYGPAAQALRELGLREIKLITNNPDKLAAARAAGLAVERALLRLTVSPDATDYLRTKAERCGHLLQVP